MPSARRLLTNDRNRLAAAGVTITPSSTKPATNSIMPPRITRAGVSNGRALLTAPSGYSGGADTEIEVEVLDSDVSDEPLVSDPVKQGPGTSTLANIAASGLDAQSFTVEWVSLGNVAKKSTADIDGIKLALKTTGDAGNLWSASVDRANTGGALPGLAFTETNFSLLRDLQAGTDEVRGAEYDWQTVVIGADGQVPATAKRLVFGEDRTVVITQWKSFVDGEWVYFFEPVIPRTLPKGTRVYEATGAIAVAFTNGTDIETVRDIVTRYDLAQGLRKISTKIDVTSTVAYDRAPGGLALRDIRFRTDAYAEPTSGEGSRFAAGFSNVVVGSNAATEVIIAECYAATSNDAAGVGVGAERWKLSGSVSGPALATLKSGDRYNHPGGRFAVTVPRKVPEGFGELPRGSTSAKVTLNGDERENGFSVCIEKPTSGVNAKDGTYTFIYKARPSGDCACEEQPWTGRLNPECLGIDIEDELMSLTSIGFQKRLIALNNWRQSFIDDQTVFGNTAVHSDVNDIALCNLTYNRLYDGLRRIYEDSESNRGESYATYEADTDYEADDFVQDGDYYYVVTTGGTTSGTPATLTTTPGDTTTENGVVFECIDKLPLPLWDGYFADAKTELAVLTGVGLSAYIEPFITETVYAVGDLVHNGGTHYYRLTALTFASTGPDWDTPPTFPTDGSSVTETSAAGNKRVWQDMGAYAGDSIQEDEDAPVKGVSYDLVTFADQYAAQMDHVISAARLDPGKKREASKLGSACWQDRGAAFRWESQDGFLWADTNEEYYSAKRILDADDNEIVIDTMEFAFYINCRCPEQLIEGDSFTITIGKAGYPATYQVGDLLILSTIATQPLAFAGGQTGDNIATLLVEGSDVGPLAPWLLDPDNPTTYNDGGLSMDYVKGGVADAVGSKYLFNVVGGHYQWRQDGGSWNGPETISATPEALADGLTLAWERNAAPSFEDGDTFTWQVQQPFAVEHLTRPTTKRWRVNGAGTHTVTVDQGSAKTFSAAAIALALGDLGAVTFKAGTDGVSWPFTVALTVTSGIAVALFAQQTYRYLQFEFAGALADAAVGWCWVGDPFYTEYDVLIEPEQAWVDIAAGDVNPAMQSLGESANMALNWEQAVLSESERNDLIAIVRDMKQNGSWPFLLIPSNLRPTEAYLLRVRDSRMAATDYMGLAEYGVQRERRYQLQLRCEGWVA